MCQDGLRNLLPPFVFVIIMINIRECQRQKIRVGSGGGQVNSNTVQVNMPLWLGESHGNEVLGRWSL